MTALLLPAAAAAAAGDEDDGEVVEKVFPLPSWDEGLPLLVLGVEIVRARWGVAGDGRGESGLVAKNSCSWKRLLSFGKARTVGSSESKESICLFRGEGSSWLGFLPQLLKRLSMQTRIEGCES